ncbi:MAG: DegT/DnrJ/EryC1/StrS family aminotransferase [Nonlabens sp.]
MKDQDFIWLSSPHMGGKERDFVNLAFDTNWVAPLGPNVNGFEEDLENYLGPGNHVAAVSSGTAAIHLALIQAGVGAGDVVICQSFTFCGSANPILYCGATPVFVDSERDTWNMCPDLFMEAVADCKKKGQVVKAVIPVHLYGMPYKVDEIHAFAKAENITVIEDAAEALGSSYKNQTCGQLGDLGVLSFNGNKMITTSGGGAVVSKTLVEKKNLIFLATQARDTAPHYEHSQLGYNYRMSNISAGIGRGQMLVLENHIEGRRSMNQFYQSLFKSIEGITVHMEPGNQFKSNHWLSCITVDPKVTGGIDRENIRLYLLELGIESRPLWKPMHLQPLYKDCAQYVNGVSNTLFNKGLCLPSGSNLTVEHRDRITKAFKNLSLI